MAKIVASIPEMQTLESTFRNQNAQVASLTSALDSAANSSTGFWEGPAAENFRTAWSQQFKPALDKLHLALEEAEREVKNRWQAIEQAGS